MASYHMCTQALHLLLLAYDVVMVSSQVVLNSSVTDGQLCPNQHISFTCIVKGSQVIAWSSDQFIGMGFSLQLSRINDIGYNRTSPTYPSTVAILTNKRTEDGMLVLESELHIETMADIFNFSISCLHANGSSDTINLQLLDEPNPPRDITFTQKNLTRLPYCVQLLIGFNPPVNLAREDVANYTIYVSNRSVLSEVNDVDKNLILAAYQVCNCYSTSETISISTTNRCGLEGQRSPNTTVIFDQETEFLPEYSCEVTTTEPTNSMSEDIPKGSDGAVIGLSVAFALSFLWALAATVISIFACYIVCAVARNDDD